MSCVAYMPCTYFKEPNLFIAIPRPWHALLHPQIQNGFHSAKEGIVLSGKFKFPSPVGLIGILTIAQKLLSHIKLEKNNQKKQDAKMEQEKSTISIEN